MKKRLLAIVFAWITLPALSQEILHRYVDTGLNNNQLLKEKQLSLQQGLLALETAKSYFLPSVTFVADYLSAQGGRTITFPAGDLLNPVYSSLNQLTSTQKFPAVKNVNAQLLPNNFYDSRLHITYPLLNTDLHYNKEISRLSVRIQEYELDIYRHELIKSIKTAWYNYCSSQDALAIYQEALLLVDQNLKVNQSLLQNGRGLVANVLRAESDRQNITAKIIGAANASADARNYLNFLINRPLTDSVVYEKAVLPDTLMQLLSMSPVTSDRGELKQLATNMELSDNVIKLNKSAYIPKLSAFLDLGSQAADFNVNSGSWYYFVGAHLEMPIFSGGRNKNNIRSAELARNALDWQNDLLTKQLQLGAETARNDLRTALATWEAAGKRWTSAKAYFKLIDQGYREGVNTQIEFVDARDQLTTSALQVSINQYDVLIRLAEYERQTATSKIK